MSSQDAESTVGRYLNALGRVSDGRLRLPIEELTRLVDHSTHMAALRLELLRALQSALSRADERRSTVNDLKDLLTDLIIMQSRLAGREARLSELLNRLVESKGLEGVALDEAGLRKGVLEIVQASDHVRAVTGDA